MPVIKYPNAFLYGFAMSTVLNMYMRRALWEPLSARPFAYLRSGIMLGCAFKYIDYHRRLAAEQIMVAED